MIVALVSLDQKWKNKLDNQRDVIRAIENIKSVMPEVDTIIFPELTLTGFCVDDKTLAEREGEDSPTVSFFSNLSKIYQCHIVFGQLALLDNDQVVNRQNVTDSTGKLLAHYDKIHTFSFAGETEYISQGKSPSTFNVNGTPIGSTICYDLRFAELYDFYRNKTEIVINTANWPSTRTSQWLCLLQARAIENQYFVVGVNRTGVDGNGLNYDRSSVVFDPLGEKLVPTVSGDDWDIYSIDTMGVSAIRERFPFVKDRRSKLYRDWSVGCSDRSIDKG